MTLLTLASAAATRPPASGAAILRGAAAVAVFAAWAVALFCAARRFAGALAQPLELPEFLTVAAAACLLAAAARALLLAGRPWSSDRRPYWPPAPALAVTLAALSLPGTRPASLAAAWLLAAAAESATWATLPRWRRWLPRPAPRLPQPGAHLAARCRAAALRPPSTAAVQQQWTRWHDASGDVLAGWISVPLQSAQRSATAHVAFCPPFAALPEVECRQQSGPPARVHVAQRLVYGLRLELKLDEPAPAAATCNVAVRAVDPSARQQHPAEPPIEQLPSSQPH